MTEDIKDISTSSEELLTNAEAVKGKQFATYARLSFLAAELNGINQHMAVCTAPECQAISAAASQAFFRGFVALISKELPSPTDQRELATLVSSLGELQQRAFNAMKGPQQ